MHGRQAESDRRHRQPETVWRRQKSGFDEIRLTGLPESGIRIAPGDTLTVPVQVATQPEYADGSSHPIRFVFKYRSEGQPENEARVIEEKSIFIGE